MEVSDELAGRLRALARTVSPEEIGELWIFPPLSEMEHSAEFVLFTRRLERDRRRVYTARATNGAPENGGGSAENGAGGNGPPPAAPRRDGPRRRAAENGGAGQRITEHGSVPSGRVERLVDRFRRRLEDDGEPIHVVIEGERERWTSLVREGPPG